jgi:hypothetical protein
VVLGGCHFEAIGLAEGVVVLGWREVEGGVADLVGLDTGEELGWTRHNKFNA